MIKKTTITIILLPALFLFLFSCSNGNFHQAGDAETNNDSGIEEAFLEQVKQQPEACDPEILNLPRAGIYAGKGSWDVNVLAIQNFLDYHEYEWSLFNEDDIVSDSLHEKFDLIWFPGGFAAEYKYYISSYENISSFVENGGFFIGSCAGANYAADILRWMGTDYDYPLKLFKGKAVGPMADQIGWGEITSFVLEKDHPANSGFDDTLETYYFDGPFFSPYENQQPIEVLARYGTNQEPAVIAGYYGNGKYLLLGPHPEIGGYSQESAAYSIDGKGGAQWPWLHSVLLWLYQW